MPCGDAQFRVRTTARLLGDGVGMATISLRLIAAPKPVQSPWMMDPVEWLTKPAPGGLEERTVHLNDGYRDWALVITAAELLAWHQRDRHRAFEGIFAFEYWRKVLDPKLAELETLLASPNCPSFFIAHWLES